MRDFLIKRTLEALAVIFAIAAITFFVLNIVPGDPVRVMLGEMADEATVQQVRHSMGLDKPVIEQFGTWLMNMLHGDFGTSYTQRKPVMDLLLNSLQYTARLAGWAYLFALVLGLVIGVLAAVHHNTWIDRTLMAISVAGISAPAFWVAVILQIIFALNLKWFPLAGVKKPMAFFLPTIALGVRYAASIARVTRTSMLEVLNQDYMRTAEAKGLARWTVILGHGFRNALIPIITIAGTQLGDIFTGSILVETIFSMNGVGSLMVNSITQRDLPLIEGGVIYIALICVIVYLVVDVLYAIVDPRIRLGGGES